MSQLHARLLTLVLAVCCFAGTGRAEIKHERGERGEAYDAFLKFHMERERLALGKAASALPDSSFLALEQAMMARLDGQQDGALEFSRRAVELAPEDPMARALLAEGLFLESRHAGSETVEQEAVLHADKYVALGGDSASVFRLLAETHAFRAGTLFRDGKTTEALARRRQAWDTLVAWVDRTDDIEAYERLHALAEESDWWDADLPFLRRHLALVDGVERTPLLQRLGRRLALLGRCQEAVPVLEEAAKAGGLEPNYAIAANVRLGRCANQVGRPEVALKAFEVALALDARNRIALEEMADALVALGQVEKADALWDSFIAAASLKFEELAAHAAWLARHERHQEAYETCKRGLALFSSPGEESSQEPDPIVAPLELQAADHAIQLRRTVEAEAHARRALFADPSSDEAVFTLTRLLWDSGRRQEALDLLKETGEKRERTDFYWGGLAGWEVRNDRYEDAARHARKFLKGFTPEGRGAEIARHRRERLAAAVLMEAGRLAEAERILQKALDGSLLRPDAARDTSYLLASVLLRKGEEAKALATLEATQDDRVTGPYAMEERVNWDLQHRRLDDALKHANRALSSISKNLLGREAVVARFKYLRAGVHLARTEYEAAAADLDAVLASPGRHSPRVHARLAEAHRRAGDFKSAEAALAAGFLEHPGSSQLRHERGRLLLAQGDEAGGLLLIEEWLARTTGSADILQAVAFELDRGGAAARALELVREAQESSPYEVTHWITSGTLLDRLGRLDEAEVHFRRALELEPDHPSAHNSLAYTLAVHGRSLDDALKLIRRALELKPGEGSYLDTLGWVYFKMERYAEAETALESAVVRNRDPVIVMHLGALRDVQGRREEALALYQEALGFGLDEDRARVTARARDLAAALSKGSAGGVAEPALALGAVGAVSR